MVKVIGNINNIPINSNNQQSPAQQPVAPDVPEQNISSFSSYIAPIARQLISPALTGIESVAGKLGDIAQVAGSALGIESEPGKGLSPAPFSSQGLRQYVREPFSKALGIDRWTIPQGELEERYNTTVGDAAALWSGNIDAKRALKISGLGNLAGFITHELGYGPGTENKVKLGTMLLSSLHGGRQQLKQQAEQQYQQVEKFIEKKPIISLKPIEKKIGNLWDEVRRGGVTKAKKDAQEQMEKLFTQIEGSDIGAKNLWDFKKDINGEILKLAPADPLRKYYDRLVGIANEGLNEIGAEAAPLLKNADKIYRDLAQSNKLGSFISENLNPNSIQNKYVKMAVKGLTYASPFATGGTSYYLGGPGGLAVAGGLGTAGIALNESTKFLNLLSKSADARKVYSDLVLSGLIGNAEALRKNIAKLDKVAQNFDKKNKQPSPRQRVIGQIKV